MSLGLRPELLDELSILITSTLSISAGTKSKWPNFYYTAAHWRQNSSE